MADLPRRIEIVPWGQPKAVTGMTFTRYQSSSYLGGGLGGSDSAASVNNTIKFDVLLDAGTWAIDVLYTSSTGYGIVTFDLGGASLGTIDMYSAGANNNASTISGITVSAAGYYTLTLTVASKNASSSGYRSAYNLIVLRRTGA